MKKHTSPETMSRKCQSGARNRYFRKKEMGAEEFRTEQQYFLERRRLINRSVHGWGVVSGFGVAPPDQGALAIGPGLALDRHGRELLLCEATHLSDGNTFVYPPAEGEDPKPWGQAQSGSYLLRAHYAERDFEDVPTAALCGCGQTEKNYVCETVIFSLERLDHEACPCDEPSCRKPCACGQGKCDSGSRGPHRCLADWIAERTASCDSGSLCRWKRYRVNPCDGVALACITIERTNDECKPIAVTAVDAACNPRRLVKNNDLLYDLIRGCDLTKISQISWGEYHRSETEMPWKTFIDDFVGNELEKKFVVTKFAVDFSGPVIASTVTEDCFAFRIIAEHSDTGWHERREVKLLAIRHAPPEADDPPGTTRSVRLCVNKGWFKETQAENIFEDECTVAQIEIYGDYILDCHGQAIDANAVGMSLRGKKDDKPRPSGNGTPGGTFLSVFRVARKPEEEAGTHGETN